MATLAPEGTDWHGILVEMGQAWTDATDGEVRLRIYPGGVVGDERDMIRKMRIGQIQGAAISTEGMTEINPYFTTFFMPLMYQSYDDVDFVREKLSHELLSETEEKIQKAIEELKIENDNFIFLVLKSNDICLN